MEQRSTQRQFPFVKELGKYIYQEAEEKGFRDGELKGFRDGELKGFHDGELKAGREKILRLAARRGLVLSDEQQARIHQCEDPPMLDCWFDNAIDATTADDIFR